MGLTSGTHQARYKVVGSFAVFSSVITIIVCVMFCLIIKSWAYEAYKNAFLMYQEFDSPDPAVHNKAFNALTRTLGDAAKTLDEKEYAELANKMGMSTNQVNSFVAQQIPQTQYVQGAPGPVVGAPGQFVQGAPGQYAQRGGAPGHQRFGIASNLASTMTKTTMWIVIGLSIFSLVCGGIIMGVGFGSAEAEAG